MLFHAYINDKYYIFKKNINEQYYVKYINELLLWYTCSLITNAIHLFIF